MPHGTRLYSIAASRHVGKAHVAECFCQLLGSRARGNLSCSMPACPHEHHAGAHLFVWVLRCVLGCEYHQEVTLHVTGFMRGSQDSTQLTQVGQLAIRYGDTFDGKTTTLCVRRATYWDPELGREDPEKKGICSNFLCDAKPGTEITMTGVPRRS